MKSVLVSNGDLDLDETTGLLQYVDGINKSSQDVARAILIEFNPFFQWGDELINTQNTQTITTGLTEPLVYQFLTSCINRLIVQSQNFIDGQRILKIQQIRTAIVGLTTVTFLVEVLYSNGQSFSVINLINLKPVQLNQLYPVDALTNF